MGSHYCHKFDTTATGSKRKRPYRIFSSQRNYITKLCRKKPLPRSACRRFSKTDGLLHRFYINIILNRTCHKIKKPPQTPPKEGLRSLSPEKSLKIHL